MKKIFNFTMFILASLAVLPSAALAQEASASPLGAMGGLMPLLLIFVFFYLFLLRPQQKKAKEHQALLNTLKRDDKVITAGGIYGTVVAVKGEIIEIKIADGVNVQVAKPSISAVITKQDEEETKIPDVIRK